MELNATLIIQGIHFLCAYGILRTFLFKPVIAAIQQEQADHEHLLAEIEARKANYSQEHKRLITEWKEYQRICATKTATIDLTKRCLFTGIQPHFISTTHDTQQIEHQTNELVALLEKRVADVG